MLLYLIWYFGRRFDLKASVNLASIALQVIFFGRHFIETGSQFCFEDSPDIFIAIFCFEDKARISIANFVFKTDRQAKV